MDPTTARDRVDEHVFLDVREPSEWLAGHIEGALHIPMGELNARREELPTDRAIVCVCRSGHRSGVVSQALVRAGFDAENLDGGMLAWAEAGIPIVTDDGRPGTVA